MADMALSIIMDAQTAKAAANVRDLAKEMTSAANTANAANAKMTGGAKEFTGAQEKVVAASGEVTRAQQSIGPAAAQSYSQATSAAQGYGEVIRQNAAQIRGIGLAVGAAGAATTLFYGKAVQAAHEQMVADRQLEAVITSTGGAAGVTAAEIQKMAGDLQKVTNYGDDATESMANVLLTFTNVKGDSFREAIPLIQDMSALLEQDLQSSAIQVGKALNDPIKGVTALSRVGVSFTAQQKEQIAAMVQAGNVAGAQGIILKELAVEFGGQARASADATTLIKNQWGELMETIGTAVMPTLTMLAHAGAPIIEWMTAMAANPLGRFFIVAAAAAGPLLILFGGFMMMLPMLMTGFGLLTGSLVLATGANGALSVMSASAAAGLVAENGAAAVGVITMGSLAVSALAVVAAMALVVIGIGLVVAMIYKGVEAWKAWHDAKENATRAKAAQQEAQTRGYVTERMVAQRMGVERQYDAGTLSAQQRREIHATRQTMQKAAGPRTQRGLTHDPVASQAPDRAKMDVDSMIDQAKALPGQMRALQAANQGGNANAAFAQIGAQPIGVAGLQQQFAPQGGGGTGRDDKLMDLMTQMKAAGQGQGIDSLMSDLRAAQMNAPRGNTWGEKQLSDTVAKIAGKLQTKSPGMDLSQFAGGADQMREAAAGLPRSSTFAPAMDLSQFTRGAAEVGTITSGLPTSSTFAVQADLSGLREGADEARSIAARSSAIDRTSGFRAINRPTTNAENVFATAATASSPEDRAARQDQLDATRDISKWLTPDANATPFTAPPDMAGLKPGELSAYSPSRLAKMSLPSLTAPSAAQPSTSIAVRERGDKIIIEIEPPDTGVEIMNRSRFAAVKK